MPSPISRSDASASSSLATRVAEVVERLQAGERVDLKAICANAPELFEELEMLLPTLEAMVDFEQSFAAEGAIGVGEPDPIRGILGDFRILREIGRGGMGIVYEALQVSLGRRVALKVLPLAATLSPQQLERFKNEARAAAALRHPHIVGVYSVGVERGVHYYAMELVEGHSLAEVIDETRMAEQGSLNEVAAGNSNIPASQSVIGNLGSPIETSPVARLSTLKTDQPAEFYREASRIIAQAADALEYAHSQGIVHRDIKPANLLLSAGGHIWITDFGLARLESDVGVTMTGDLLGTLRYMSPEQAAGRPTMIDHRTDIHSLGVTLYELVAGQPPFATKDRQQLLREITERDSPALRQLNREIPPDLETIVRKAMEKEPDDRYPSAAAMAADLHAFVEGRAITASPPSWATRFTKWTRRNSTAIAAVLGMLLLASLGLAVATAMIGRARMVAVQKAQEAEQNAEKANEHYRLALDAVDQMLTRVGDEKLKNIPLVEDVRRELLEDAVKLYQRFLDREPVDPQVRIEMGIVHQRLAKLLKQLGRRFEAENSIARSIDLLKQGARDTTGDARVQLELARSLITAGSVRHDLDAFEQGITVLREFAPGSPSAREATLQLADALNLVANLTEDTGNPEQAAHLFAEAELLFEQLLERGSEDVILQRAYAKLLMNHGISLGRRGNWQAELAKHEQALEIGKRLTQTNREAEDRHIYGAALLNCGAVKLKQKAYENDGSQGETSDEPDYSEAVAYFSAATDVFRELTKDYPAVLAYRQRLLAVIGNLTMCYRSDPNRFIPLGEEAIGIARQLVAEFPDKAQYHRDKAQYHRLYGGVLSNMASRLQSNHLDLDRAAQLIREAIQQQRLALKAQPDNPVSQEFLVKHHLVLADIIIAQNGEPGDVIDVCERGLEIAERFCSKYPNNPSVRQDIDLLNELIRKAIEEEARRAAEPNDEDAARSPNAVLTSFNVAYR